MPQVNRSLSALACWTFLVAFYGPFSQGPTCAGRLRFGPHKTGLGSCLILLRPSTLLPMNPEGYGSDCDVPPSGQAARGPPGVSASPVPGEVWVGRAKRSRGKGVWTGLRGMQLCHSLSASLSEAFWLLGDILSVRRVLVSCVPGHIYGLPSRLMRRSGLVGLSMRLISLP